MKTIASFVLFLTVAAVLSRTPEEGFKKADANANDKVDMKEVTDFFDTEVGIENVNEKFLQEAFDQADGNTDKEVSMKEFKAWNKKYGK